MALPAGFFEDVHSTAVREPTGSAESGERNEWATVAEAAKRLSVFNDRLEPSCRRSSTARPRRPRADMPDDELPRLVPARRTIPRVADVGEPVRPTR